MLLTFLSWLVGNGVGNGRSTAKVDADNWVALTRLQDIGHVVLPLTELIIRRSNDMTAQFDCGKSVQPVEYQPAALCFVRSKANRSMTFIVFPAINLQSLDRFAGVCPVGPSNPPEVDFICAVVPMAAISIIKPRPCYTLVLLRISCN